MAGADPLFPCSLTKHSFYDLTSSACPYATARCFDRCHFIYSSSISNCPHSACVTLHSKHFTHNYEYYLFFAIPPSYFRLSEGQGACILCSLIQSCPLELCLALVNVSLFCDPRFTNEKVHLGVTVIPTYWYSLD